jgi:S-formylglutathione hydrolase FrmB
MGVSMGAEGALRIALHRPGTFASVASISGPTMDTDRRIAFMNDPLVSAIIPTHHVFGPVQPRARIEADDPFVLWQSPEDLGGLRVFLAWGTRDRGEIQAGGEALVQHLTERAIPHEHRVFEGDHGWVSWAPVIEEALRIQVPTGVLAP